jgi:DNA-binding MarR family transcriptional regulator
MNEEILKKIILLSREKHALDNLIFEQVIHKKVIGKFKELSKNQPMVIGIIGTKGEIMSSTIGDCIGMDKSSLSRMVDDLEKKGMVLRKTDSEDRRKVLISLTDKGLRCYYYLHKVIIEQLELADEKDLEEYMHILEEMVKIQRKMAKRQGLIPQDILEI